MNKNDWDLHDSTFNMTGLVNWGAAHPSAQLPVAIDYPAALTRADFLLRQQYPFVQLKMMIATLRIPLERRNEKTGRTEKVRLWEITDRTARTWLNEAIEAAAADGVVFSIPVTLQSLLGHKGVKSTEIYTRVFALDVAARHRVQFHMSGNEAVDLLKPIKTDST